MKQMPCGNWDTRLCLQTPYNNEVRSGSHAAGSAPLFPDHKYPQKMRYIGVLSTAASGFLTCPSIRLNLLTMYHLIKNISFSRRRLMFLILMLIGAGRLHSQDLDPRAYLWVPEGTNTAIAGFSFMTGNVLTDPTLPIKDLQITAQSPSVAMVHVFNLFGMSSQALVAVPVAFAQASGEVNGQHEETNRSGLGDIRLRWTLLMLGAPSATLQEIKSAKHTTILGFSLNIQTPTGQYFSDKLINLGTHRWSFRPELALSQPIARRWLLDVYAGVWLFTPNDEFYPGNAERTQKPLGSFQAHMSYNINPLTWIAINTTYYAGGTSTINSTLNDDRQSNFRIGLTGVMPVGKRSSIKLAASTGAVVRSGQDFTVFSIGYQTSWFRKSDL